MSDENRPEQNAMRRMTMPGLAAVLLCAALPASAADDCAKVRAAYKAGGQKQLHMEVSGKVTTQDMSMIHRNKITDTCKLLRSEKYKGEDAFVYLEHVSGVAGTADETIWVSKATGFMLHQDVRTRIQGRGDGHITVDVKNETK